MSEFVTMNDWFNLLNLLNKCLKRRLTDKFKRQYPSRPLASRKRPTAGLRCEATLPVKGDGPFLSCCKSITLGDQDVCGEPLEKGWAFFLRGNVKSMAFALAG